MESGEYRGKRKYIVYSFYFMCVCKGNGLGVKGARLKDQGEGRVFSMHKCIMQNAQLR